MDHGQDQARRLAEPGDCRRVRWRLRVGADGEPAGARRDRQHRLRRAAAAHPGSFGVPLQAVLAAVGDLPFGVGPVEVPEAARVYLLFDPTADGKRRACPAGRPDPASADPVRPGRGDAETDHPQLPAWRAGSVRYQGADREAPCCSVVHGTDTRLTGASSARLGPIQPTVSPGEREISLTRPGPNGHLLAGAALWCARFSKGLPAGRQSAEHERGESGTNACFFLLCLCFLLAALDVASSLIGVPLTSVGWLAHGFDAAPAGPVRSPSMCSSAADGSSARRRSRSGAPRRRRLAACSANSPPRSQRRRCPAEGRAATGLARPMTFRSPSSGSRTCRVTSSSTARASWRGPCSAEFRPAA